MDEHARFLGWMREADELARRLEALGDELRALGDVQAIVSFDAIREDIASIETAHVATDGLTFALRA